MQTIWGWKISNKLPSADHPDIQKLANALGVLDFQQVSLKDVFEQENKLTYDDFYRIKNKEKRWYDNS